MQQTEWVEATVARLFCGEVKEVVENLNHLEAQDAQAAEVVRKLIGYLTSHQLRVDYGFARKAGYPIGSGGIKSANKSISHVRLKRSGGLGGMWRRRTRGSPCAVPSTTTHSRGSSMTTNRESNKAL